MYQSLSNLKIGQTAKIISINIKDKKIKQHLMDMGITRNTIITIKRIAPSGDPIDIGLRGYELCVGKKELSGIIVEAIRK